MQKNQKPGLAERKNCVILQVVGGCNGNLQGISALVKGMKAEEAITRLKGINCGGRGTSCPDQFARGLEAAMAQK